MGVTKNRCLNLPAASGAVVGAPTGKTCPATFAGLTVYNSGANPVSVEIYDNASAATGTLLAAADLTAKGTNGSWAHIDLADGVLFMNGLFANYIGTTPAPKGSVRYS